MFFMPVDIQLPPNDGFLRCLLLRIVDIEKATFERIGNVATHLAAASAELLKELDEETKARLPCLR